MRWFLFLRGLFDHSLAVDCLTEWSKHHDASLLAQSFLPKGKKRSSCLASALPLPSSLAKLLLFPEHPELPSLLLRLS